MAINVLRSIFAPRLFFRLYVRLVLRSPINIIIGRLIFGTDSGLYAHVVGFVASRIDYFRSKRRGFRPPSRGERSNMLADKGYFYDGGFISSGRLALVRSIWEDYCRDKRQPSDGRLQLSSECDFLLHTKLFENLYTLFDRELQEVFESYYSANVRVLNIHIYRTSHVSSGVSGMAYGQTESWHTDGSTTDAVKLFILLSDVGQADGPMMALSARDTANIFRRDPFMSGSLLCSDRVIGSSQVFSFTGPMGSVMGCRTNECLHRATMPSIGRTRDMAVFYLTSSPYSILSQPVYKANLSQFFGVKRILLGI